MDRAYLLEVARRASGLTQAELAARSGTPQATMSAYERGLKSPTLKVAARILEAAGYDLNLRRLIDWVEHEAPGVGHFWVPSTLWHVETPDCFAILAFPDLIGDGPMREWDMHDRAQRKGVYEQLLQGGSPEEMIRWIDGPLLVDVWEELELPDAVREAWKWPIVIARGPTHPDTVRILGRGDDSFTAEAWVRGHEAVPRRAPTPKEPRVRFIRTRFDPRPPEPTAGGDGMKPAATVARIAERLATQLATSRHPSVLATWNAGVAFARRWADLGNGHTVVLAPSGPGCVVGVTVEPYDDRLDVGHQLITLWRSG
jgi:transcriptional regulator with XRE-family HTH domain